MMSDQCLECGEILKKGVCVYCSPAYPADMREAENRGLEKAAQYLERYEIGEGRGEAVLGRHAAVIRTFKKEK